MGQSSQVAGPTPRFHLDSIHSFYFPQIQIYSQTHVRSMTDQPRPSPDHSQNLSGGQANAGSADPRSGRIERPKRCRDQGAQPLCGPLGALFDAQSRQAAHGFGSTPASFLHAQGAAIVTTLEWRAANRQTYHLELGICICTAASVVEPRGVRLSLGIGRDELVLHPTKRRGCHRMIAETGNGEWASAPRIEGGE